MCLCPFVLIEFEWFVVKLSFIYHKNKTDIFSFTGFIKVNLQEKCSLVMTLIKSTVKNPSISLGTSLKLDSLELV